MLEVEKKDKAGRPSETEENNALDVLFKLDED